MAGGSSTSSSISSTRRCTSAPTARSNPCPCGQRASPTSTPRCWPPCAIWGFQSPFTARPTNFRKPSPSPRITRRGSTMAPSRARFWRALVQADRVLKLFRTALPRQGQPDTLFLGQFRPGGDPLFRPPRAPSIPAECPISPTPSPGKPIRTRCPAPASGRAVQASQKRCSIHTPGRSRPGFATRRSRRRRRASTRRWGNSSYPTRRCVRRRTPTKRCSEFLASTYAAAADLAGWDREALECGFGVPGKPRVV